MIFLPGTFLAVRDFCSYLVHPQTDMMKQSIFSMTFFNWSATDGESVVSPYIGIYFGAVFVITLLVVGLWVAYTKRWIGRKVTEKSPV